MFADTDVVMPSGIPFIPYNVKSSTFEVSVALFDACNLNCTFCFSKRKDPIDINHILKMPEEIVPFVVRDIKKYNIQNLNIRSWGGELFADFIPDDVFDSYLAYSDKYKELLHKECPNLQINMHWLSNGVWTKWERVKKVLDYTKGSLSFSYDPINRFSNDNQKDLLFSNIDRFIDYHNSISITLTKHNMERYREGDKWFDSLDYQYTIDSNYYWPNRDWETNMPNDDDLFEFFKWGIDNKRYNIDVINALIMCGLHRSSERFCNCFFTGQYNLGKYTKDCVRRTSVLDPNDFYDNKADEVNEDNCQAVKNSMMLRKRGCLMCPNFSNCCMGCMGCMLYKEYKVGNCPFSRIYDYVQANKQLIEPSFDLAQPIIKAYKDGRNKNV